MVSKFNSKFQWANLNNYLVLTKFGRNFNDLYLNSYDTSKQASHLCESLGSHTRVPHVCVFNASLPVGPATS